MTAPYSAIVLAGGTAARLGGIDKALVVVAGRSLLERTVVAVDGAQQVIVVGPRRRLAVPKPVNWCREYPPGGGPAAAIATGLAAVDADWVVVLAVDQPFIAPAVPLLVAAVTGDEAAGVAALAGPDGRINYLAAAWRRNALAAAIEARGGLHGTAVRDLFDSVRVVAVPDTGGWGLDCDTPEQLAASRCRSDTTLLAPTAPDRTPH